MSSRYINITLNIKISVYSISSYETELYVTRIDIDVPTRHFFFILVNLLHIQLSLIATYTLCTNLDIYVATRHFIFINTFNMKLSLIGTYAIYTNLDIYVPTRHFLFIPVAMSYSSLFTFHIQLKLKISVYSITSYETDLYETELYVNRIDIYVPTRHFLFIPVAMSFS